MINTKKCNSVIKNTCSKCGCRKKRKSSLIEKLKDALHKIRLFLQP